MTITLGKLEHVDPRSLWIREAVSFTPWLAEHLHLLGEAIGLDLEKVQTEAPVGSFLCDIEARETGSNRAVIIENQLEATDHRHLGQLLTYASGLDAAVIVWISPEIREEHRQALDWLNRYTDENVDFFGVNLELIKIDDSKPAVQFRPVAFPNAWSKTRASSNSGTVTERELAYQDFFQPVLDELRESHRFTNARAAQPQSWYSFSSGVKGILYSASFASGERLRAEVYIDIGNAARNKATYEWLHERKELLEQQMGGLLEWEKLEQRRASRISVVRNGTSISSVARDGDEMRTWLIDHLLKLKAVFGPLLPQAVASSATLIDP